MFKQAEALRDHDERAAQNASHLAQPLKQLRLAQRELLPPVVRVQMALHPWVAYAILPVFAFANAGLALAGLGLSELLSP